jgi:hypothetical protein
MGITTKSSLFSTVGNFIHMEEHLKRNRAAVGRVNLTYWEWRKSENMGRSSAAQGHNKNASNT